MITEIIPWLLSLYVQSTVTPFVLKSFFASVIS